MILHILNNTIIVLLKSGTSDLFVRDFSQMKAADERL